MQELVAGLVVLAAGIYLVWHFVRVGRKKVLSLSCAGCLGCRSPLIPLERAENLPFAPKLGSFPLDRGPAHEGNQSDNSSQRPSPRLPKEEPFR